MCIAPNHGRKCTDTPFGIFSALSVSLLGVPFFIPFVLSGFGLSGYPTARISASAPLAAFLASLFMALTSATASHNLAQL
jgi:hypothetical protein